MDEAGSSRSRSKERRRARVSARLALFDSAFPAGGTPAGLSGVIPDRADEKFFPVVDRGYGRGRRRERSEKRLMLSWARRGNYQFRVTELIFSAVYGVSESYLQGPELSWSS